MNRWGVYEMLKGNKQIDIKIIENTSSNEVKEGVIEFLMAKGIKEKEIEGESNMCIENLRNDLHESIEQFGTTDPRTIGKSQELDKEIEIEQLKKEVLYFMKRSVQAERLLKNVECYCPVQSKNEIREFVGCKVEPKKYQSKGIMMPDEMQAVSVQQIVDSIVKIECLKKALLEIRNNMRNIEIGNEADSYIDDTLEIIENVLGE